MTSKVKKEKELRTEYVSIRISEETSAAIREIADRDGRTLSGQINYVIRQFIEKNKESKNG